MADILQLQDIKANGYGTITQTPMRDKRLKPNAKSIYSYLCSFAGKGNSAFPRRDTILSELGMGVDTYCKHMKQLKELGYIKVTQERNKAGRFSRNVYTLMQEIPVTTSASYREQQPPIQASAPCREKPNTDKPNTENQDTYIFYNYHLKDKNIKRTENNHVKSVMSCKPVDNSVDRQDMTGQKIAAYTQIIKDNISYCDFSPLDVPLIDDFIAVIIDVLLTDSGTIKISGEDKPRSLVKHLLVHLDYCDILHCITQFKDITARINNKRQYMLTMMYNCKMEGNAHYTNQVRSCE